MITDRRLAICNSALWAAYGDALGYMTELTDTKGLRWRTGSDWVKQTLPWRRRVGGPFGAVIEFPAGSYSDDTQLRLSVARAIGSGGRFDAEAFAKIELVIWQAYALGAGKGSKLAAANLSRRDVNWFSNFYNVAGASYWMGGGNGAAMRIQPHVWAATSLKDRDALATSILRDAVCTHGHPRALAGAILHGWWLAYVLDMGSVPEPASWYVDVEQIVRMEDWLAQDEMLATFWMAAWKQNSDIGIKEAMIQVRDELMRDIDTLDAPSLVDADYKTLVESIGGFDPKQVGSGTKTALLATKLAWEHRDRGVEKAVIDAANTLGSDTDTVATMVGAMLGALATEPPNGALQDRVYIQTTAERLYRIAQGSQERSFPYPDPGRWTAPKTLLDAVLERDGEIEIQGLGHASIIDAPIPADKSGDSIRQWFRLGFDQSVLMKRRINTSSNKTKQKIIENTKKEQVKKESAKKERVVMNDLLTMTESPNNQDTKQNQRDIVNNKNRMKTLDEKTQEAIRSGFNETLIGQHLLEFAVEPDGIEKAIAYAAIILKAKRTRWRKEVGEM